MGEGLTTTGEVDFGGVAATTFDVLSDAEIEVTVPQGAPSGPVSIRTGEGTTVSQDSFVVQPNIVLILTDDQRWDQVVDPRTGLAYMPTVKSQLMDRGMTFENGFVVNPTCCPSRTTILTGQYSHHTHIYRNVPPYGGFSTFTNSGEDQSTVATWLQAAGYRTGFVGKYLNGYLPSRAQYEPPGWNVWNALALSSNGGERRGGYFNYTMSVDGVPKSYGATDPTDYSTNVLRDDAVSFIQGTPSSKPLFLMFTPRAPHADATPAKKHSGAYPYCSSGSTTLPCIRKLRPYSDPAYNETNVSDKPPYIQAIPPWTDAEKKAEDAFWRRQLQSLLSVDDAVRAILDSLREEGRLSNTLIVYASDNGLEAGEHRWRNKYVPYEESIRVPLIIRYDPLTSSATDVDDHLVLNMDLAPTFADAASITAPSMDGRSLLPLLSGQSSTWRSDFAIEHMDTPKSPEVPTYCAVRTKRYSYVEYQDHFEELYDIQNDPAELNNLLAPGNPPDPQVAAAEVTLHQRLLQLCSPPPPDFPSP